MTDRSVGARKALFSTASIILLGDIYKIAMQVVTHGITQPLSRFSFEQDETIRLEATVITGSKARPQDQIQLFSANTAPTTRGTDTRDSNASMGDIICPLI